MSVNCTILSVSQVTYAYQLLHSEVNNFLHQMREIFKRDTTVKYIFLTAACVSVVPENDCDTVYMS